MIDMDRVPRHIAIIPDGNRRWSSKKGISRKEGYAKGIRKIGDVLKWCREADVKMLTMWGFSSENFRRDRGEVKELFGLFQENLKKALGHEDETKKKVKVRFLGRLDRFPKHIVDMMKKAEAECPKDAKYQLNLLLSYGGREEVIDAVNRIITNGIKKVNEKTISENLYTEGIPDPDLVIRTSGEQRLSGLMPWQTVYSELYFCKKLWPDFSKRDFLKALESYAKRKRRYGK